MYWAERGREFWSAWPSGHGKNLASKQVVGKPFHASQVNTMLVHIERNPRTENTEKKRND